MTLAINTPPVSHVIGSRAWLTDRLANRCTLHAVPDTDNTGHLRTLRIELRWERDGKKERRILTILDTDNDVDDSDQYEGLPTLTPGCLAAIQSATEGLLARMLSEADAVPVHLIPHGATP